MAPHSRNNLFHLFRHFPSDEDDDLETSCHSTVSTHTFKKPYPPISTTRRSSKGVVAFSSHVLVWDHIHVNDYSADEKNMCWLKQTDIDRMRVDRKVTVRLITTATHDVNSEEQLKIDDGRHYYRGLEHHFQEEAHRRHFYIDNSRAVVCNAQRLLSDSATIAQRWLLHVALAEEYRACTSDSVRRAVERAREDARVALLQE